MNPLPPMCPSGPARVWRRLLSGVVGTFVLAAVLGCSPEPSASTSPRAAGSTVPAQPATTGAAVAPDAQAVQLVAATPAPTPASAAASTPAATSTGPQIELNCEESSVTYAGAYLAENNSWGRQGVVGWTQCMGAATNARGGISAHWNWNWRQQGDNVKAYPEVVFGHKPGYPKSTTTLLPRKLAKIQTLVLDYDVQTEREGTGNMAIDMWLTNTVTPASFAAPPITHEIMIWLEVFGPMYPGGQQVDKVRINGTMYRVFVGEKFGLGWRYLAFVPNSPMQTMGSIDLMPFFVYLKGKKLITTEEFLSTVNFGNELISGSGETKLNRFAVTVN